MAWAGWWLCVGLAWGSDTARFSNRYAPEPAVVPTEEVTRGYLFADRIFHELARVAAVHPEVEVERIGHSAQGRPLFAFHVPATGHPERRVLVFGGIHALEWIGVQVATATLLDAIVRPREHVAVTVVVLLNPDGRQRVEDDLVVGRNAYRRGNGRGIDLNRDFAVHHEASSVWRKLLPAYHASSPAPLSQPESQALDQLVARERYDRAASLHAFGGFFYHPWSGRWARPADWPAFVQLGRAMEAAQPTQAYRTRQLSRWGFFFRAHGSEIDHLYGRYGTLAFLVELTRSGVNPLRPADWRTRFRWYNPRHPERHVRQGLAAMRALIDTDL